MEDISVDNNVSSDLDLEKSNSEESPKFGSLIVKKKRVRKGKRVYVSAETREKTQKKQASKRKRKKLEAIGGVKDKPVSADSENSSSTILITRKVEERKLRPIEKLKNIISYGFVCLLAVVLGFMAGNMYVEATFSQSYEFEETEYRFSDAELQTIIASNKNVSTTNSLYAFVIAEEKLKTLDYVCETPEGSSYTSPDIAPTQSIYSYRKKNGADYEYLTVTDGIMAVSEKVITTDGGENFSIWRSKNLKDGKPVFADDPTFKMTYAEAREEYGTDPVNPIPYVVSLKTIESSYNSDASSTGLGNRNANGNYDFTLKLNTSQSVMNYVKQMKHMSELKNYPVFYNITINFELDSEFRFISMKIVEDYKVTYFGVPASCHAEMHQKFSY